MEKMDEEIKREVDKLMRGWKKVWKNNGEPHPSSNDYLALNRAFFYEQGFKAGVRAEKRFGSRN